MLMLQEAPVAADAMPPLVAMMLMLHTLSERL